METSPLNPRCPALLVVDIQPDFLPGGALPVADGNAILGGVRTLMESDLFAVQAATQDWHPANHVSFASNHPGRQPMEVIRLHGRDQILWPDHCVQGTRGAQLHPELPWERVSVVVRKGTAPDVDSYSGLRNNWNADGDRPATGLAGYLRERGVDTVYLCGLARDFCVKWTAEDAVGAGFDVVVLWDLTRAVDPSTDASVRAALEDRGARIMGWRELMA